MSTDDIDLAPGDLTVDLVDDAAGKDSAAAKPAVPTAIEDELRELKSRAEASQRETDRARAAEQAERERAQRLAHEVGKERSRANETEADAVATALGAAQSEIDAAKRELASALNAGEFDKVPDLQEKVSAAVALRYDLDRQQKQIEARKTEPARRQNDQPQGYLPADPVEQIIARAAQAGQPISPRAQTFLRAHPECITDEERNARMQWAHRAALRQFTPESEDYFNFVERELGYRKDDGNEPAPTTPAVRTRTVMPAAPVTREQSAAVTPSKSQVKLTAGEVASANDGTIVWNTGPNKGKPIGTQEMARRKSMLTEQGAYDRRYTQ